MIGNIHIYSSSWSLQRSQYEIINFYTFWKLTFWITSGVPKSFPPCRRNPQGCASTRDSRAVITCDIFSGEEIENRFVILMNKGLRTFENYIKLFMQILSYFVFRSVPAVHETHFVYWEYHSIFIHNDKNIAFPPHRYYEKSHSFSKFDKQIYWKSDLIILNETQFSQLSLSKMIAEIMSHGVFWTHPAAVYLWSRLQQRPRVVTREMVVKIYIWSLVLCTMGFCLFYFAETAIYVCQ